MIRQLLNISTTPLKLSTNLQNSKASFEINVTKSQLEVKSNPIKVNIDSREMRASMGIYTPDMFREKTVQDSKQIVLDTIAQTVDDWQSIEETQGRSMIDICMRNSGSTTVELTQSWSPSQKPNISWTGGTLPQINFSPYRLDINWSIPLKPDVSVSQWNKVNIEYLGTKEDVMILGREAASKFKI